MYRFWLVLVVLLPHTVWAQNVSGSLSGTVCDSSNAVMPAIEIKVSSELTHFLRTTTTNAEGFFAFPDLAPATYTLDISAVGFKRFTMAGIELSGGDRRSLGTIQLAVGTVTEVMTVSATVAPVMLGSSGRAGVLTGHEIEQLALRGRDFVDAIGLLPGIVDTSDSREAPSNTSTNTIFILGGRQTQKNVTLDGVVNLDGGGNAGLHNTPSMDSIGEIQVMMSNYAPEYGRNSGGTINVITKGGGTAFHASGSWYHRHEEFNANNFFDNRNGVSRPRYRYNIAGYTASGPIYVPGHFNRDRSRLFFFFSQEFQRQLVTYGTTTVRVPSEMERRGDFSQSMDVNGRLIPVLDPLAGRTQFPNNIVPASRLDAVGRNILNLFPLPNFVDPTPSRRYQWNYIASLSEPYPRRTETVRVDYSPRQTVQFYVRLSHTSDHQLPPYGLGVNGSVNFPLTNIVFRYPGRGAALHNTLTISPTLVNDWTLGFSQQKATTYPQNPDAISRKTTGITVPQWYPGVNAQGFIPNMIFGGVPNYANPSLDNRLPLYNTNPTFSLSENLNKIWGTHAFKLGIYAERNRKDTSASGTSVPFRGSLVFSPDSTNPVDANYAYANAFLGYFDSYSEGSARPYAMFRFTNFEWYAQDAWRVRPRLLLDYGVRFYHDPALYDVRDQLATFVPGFYDRAKAPILLWPGLNDRNQKVAVDPRTGKQYPVAYIGTFVPGVGNPAVGMAIAGKGGFPRSLYTLPSVSLAPRFGFSWDPLGRGRTAIRGGAGVFFDRITGSVNQTTQNNPPTVFSPTIYYGTLADLAQTAGSAVLAPTGTMNSIFGDHARGAVYNFSMGVQQQIARGTILDVSYVGSLARHLLWGRNINAVPIGARFLNQHPENRDPSSPTVALPANFMRPYAGFGDIMLMEPASTSNYHSLQVNLNYRMKRGGQFGLAYTFSKALGTANTDGNSISPFFSPRQRNYGLLIYDRTHYLTLRYNYPLPTPGKRFGIPVVAALTDGWILSGISRFTSGAPFTPGFSTVVSQDFTGTPSESARIQVIDPEAPAVSRFGPPAVGSLGNGGISILRGPGVSNWDIALFREIKVYERMVAQLRLETYNTFNHTQFSSVSTTARFDAQGRQIDPLFLQPTAARPARRVQLSLRLNW